MHTILRPDDQGRIMIDNIPKEISSYKMTVKDNKIILEPYTEIPLCELWLLSNPDALKNVLEGINDSKSGHVEYLGDFSQYVEEK